MSERVALENASGSWAHCVASVNHLIDDLVRPTTEVARVIQAVAQGDLTQKMALNIEWPAGQGRVPADRHRRQRHGRPARQLRRRGHPGGPRGGHRGQARRPGQGQRRVAARGRTSPTTSTSWPATSPARCATSPRSPPPSPRATCPRRSPSTPGARSSSSRTPSTPWSTSSAASPTRSPASPARSAPRASSAARPRSRACRGTWKDLTDTVNFMAGNLTDQVRNIAQVSTAVARGDLVPADHRRGQGRGGRAGRHASTR